MLALVSCLCEELTMVSWGRLSWPPWSRKMHRFISHPLPMKHFFFLIELHLRRLRKSKTISVKLNVPSTAFLWLSGILGLKWNANHELSDRILKLGVFLYLDTRRRRWCMGCRRVTCSSFVASVMPAPHRIRPFDMLCIWAHESFDWGKNVLTQVLLVLSLTRVIIFIHTYMGETESTSN